MAVEPAEINAKRRRWLRLPLRDLLWIVTVIAVCLGWLTERLARMDAEQRWESVISRLANIQWQLEQHGFVFESVPDTNETEVQIRLTRPKLLTRSNGYLIIDKPDNTDESDSE